MTDFRNINIKFHKNSFYWSQIAPCGRTGRQTWRSLIVAFHNFAKAPKNQSSYQKFLIPFTQSKRKWEVKTLWFSSSCTVRIVTPTRWGSGNDSDLIKLTFRWPCIMQWFLVIVQLDAQILFNVFIYLLFSTCFEHVMLIIRRNKLYQYSFW